MNNILNLVNNTIVKFTKEFNENPYNFLYENDIHSVLFTRIFDELKNKNLFVKLKGGFGKGKYDGNVPGKYNCYKNGMIKTNLAKTEYKDKIFMSENDNNKGSANFDIAILDIDQSGTIDHTKKNDAFWNKRVSVGIEIKYCQQDFFSIKGTLPFVCKKKYEEKIYYDLKKLDKYQKKNNNFTGILLVFYQCQFPDKLKNKKEFVNYLKKINNLTINKKEIVCFLIEPDRNKIEANIYTLIKKN